jgi:hypothetical protein
MQAGLKINLAAGAEEIGLAVMLQDLRNSYLFLPGNPEKSGFFRSSVPGGFRAGCRLQHP